MARTAPQHQVDDRHDPGPVLDRRVIGQVVGRVGDQAEEGPQQEGLPEGACLQGGATTKTTIPATKSR